MTVQGTARAGPLRHPYLVHLRLGFNLLLTPIYLWGALNAGGSLTQPTFWLGYLSLHIFLYGGTTAFNSYYDRDEGPIGGLLHPPPVDRGLLRFSLAFQALGLLPALLVGWPFTLAWLLLFVVFTAYSHPLVRLKSKPAVALLAIALGQGAVGFALGWLAVAGDPATWSASLSGPVALAGMLSTALVVTGLYLVTQSYQVEEDRRRGDITLAVLLGERRSLLVALLPLAAGGALMVWRVWQLQGAGWAATLTALFLCLGVWLLAWARSLDPGRVEVNFRAAMRFTATASLSLSLFLLIPLLFG